MSSLIQQIVREGCAGCGQSVYFTDCEAIAMEPDDDYENPVGEMLDVDTVRDLACTHLVAMMNRVLSLGWSSTWPFLNP